MTSSLLRRLSALASRATACLSTRRGDRELAAELDAHLQAHIDENLRAGMTRHEAQRWALLTLGGMAMTKEAYQEQRGLPWIENVARDMRHAFRTLRRSPVFAGAAVFTLVPSARTCRSSRSCTACS
jgi:macrolide transport system ATP-binding/permease protein